jgi:hypothetical protein
LWIIRRDSASYGRDARRGVTVFEVPMNSSLRVAALSALHKLNAHFEGDRLA